jgi:methylated-DNA-[protein]-cysteine S-methyltransferase
MSSTPRSIDPEDLRSAFDVESSELDALRQRLAVEADRNGLLDLAHRTFDSPLGPLLLVVGVEGVVRVAFEQEGHDQVLAELAERISARMLSDRRRTDVVARQLDDYFAGRRGHLDVPVDLRLVHGFRREVIDRLRSIPAGERWSYAELARAAGRPAAVRAVASACANNPVPIVVPCHRVVRSDGSIGRYLGGTDAKVALLELEARSVA